MDREIRSFDEYFQLYLKERQKPWTRRLQLLGTSVALSCVAGSLLTGQRSLLLGAAAAAFGPAWFSHRFIEKNRPETSRYLAWRLRADLLLLSQTVQAALSGSETRDEAVLAQSVHTFHPLPDSDATPRPKNGKVNGTAKRNGHAPPHPGSEAETIRVGSTTPRGWAVWE